jgi:WD40 repeat protein
VKDVQWLSESTFVSGDLHGEIRLWNVGKGSPRANLQGHTQKIVGLLSYSDDLCVSGSADATVQVWRPFTPQNKRIKGEERPSFRAQNILQQTSGVTALAELNKFVWSALADNSLVQWDLTKGQKVSSMLLKRPANVLCANGSLLFAAHSHSTLSIMDPRTFQPLKIKCTAKMISSLSSVQNYILAGHHDGSLRLWDLRNTNAPLWLDPAQEEAQAKILAVELVSTNNFFSGGEDGKLKRYSQ